MCVCVCVCVCASFIQIIYFKNQKHHYKDKKMKQGSTQKYRQANITKILLTKSIKKCILKSYL